MPSANSTMHDERVRAEAEPATLEADDHAEGVDDGEHDPEPGEPAVEVARRREHRLPGHEVGDEEEADLEGVPAEDVGDRELIVAEPHSGDAGADLGKSRREREHGRAEDHAVHVRPVRQGRARDLEQDTGAERDPAATAKTTIERRMEPAGFAGAEG